jgi:hypothetical protein
MHIAHTSQGLQECDILLPWLQLAATAACTVTGTTCSCVGVVVYDAGPSRPSPAAAGIFAGHLLYFTVS